MHPAFRGSFPTAQYMYERGLELDQSELINFGTAADPDWRFVGRDFIRLWPGQAWRGNPTTRPAGQPGHDPMEAAPFNFPGNAQAAAAGWTSHGTHVSGTIVGRDVAAHGNTDNNYDVSILGVAPGALAIHYRALWGSTPNTVITAAFERAVLDGADVVNMSLGGGVASAVDVQGIAINNLMLADPYLVFVISAGNNGPNYRTSGNPSGATMAISVSALKEPQDFGLEMRWPSPTGVGRTSFMLPNVAWYLDQLPNGNYIFDIDSITTRADGTMTVFAMPVTPGSPVGAGQNATTAPPVGAGTANDFAELERIHGREALEGHFVLVRRGYTFSDITLHANRLGLGGVIQINTIQQPPAAGGVSGALMLSMFYTEGFELAQWLNLNQDPADRWGTIWFSDTLGELGDLHLQGFSSRGPVLGSLEITPDVGAHGVHVWSSMPRWSLDLPWQTDTVPWQEHWRNDDNWITAYWFMSGTSMSGPHVAGGVALMVQYSRENGGQWESTEIKARIVNTAIPVTYQSDIIPEHTPVRGVFNGSRQMDVWAAVQATTVVSVEYSRVTTIPGRSFGAQPLVTTTKGSFSFGGLGDGQSNSLTAIINSQEGGVYTITHEFILDGRLSQEGATLALSRNSVTVAPGASETFVATLTMPAVAVPAGHYEGYITVTKGEAVVARLPFAAVGITVSPPVFDGSVFLYSSVVSGDSLFPVGNAISPLASQLGIFFTPNDGFYFDMFLYRVDGEDLIPVGPGGDNWLGSRQAPLIGHRDGSNIGGPMRGQQHRAMILDIYPLGLAEGEYTLRLDVHRSTWTGYTIINDNWIQAETIYLPFWVDNTPPVLQDLDIQGINLGNINLLDFDGETVTVMPTDRTDNEIVITGNVFDAWTDEMMGEDVFGIWRNAEAGMDNVAVFVLLGENTPANRPVRAELDEDGNFAVTIEVDEEADTFDITIWAVDGWSVLPNVDGFLHAGGPGLHPNWASQAGVMAVLRTLNHRDHFALPFGLIGADAALNTDLHQGRWYWQSAAIGARMGEHVWSGLNVTEFNVSIVEEFPTFTLNIFNNGHSNNASLATLGVIRMWTQLNGQNALVPYAGLEITAEFPNGQCAMHVININRPWNNQGFVNFIDADKTVNWQRIYLTATLFGQTVDAVLINDLYVTRTLGFQAFNNGNDNHAGLAGTIRIWTQINGVNTLIPYADITVTATHLNGECAMEFVRINRPWNNQAYVNLFDVTKTDADWQYINFAVELNGQVAELLLINNLY
ncbi:MAG: S8 family serine peptidase [Defluviitaleaceae bacterium]|nr:S8 family serine peptidase [Defluviitaleaceae bacterium]